MQSRVAPQSFLNSPVRQEVSPLPRAAKASMVDGDLENLRQLPLEKHPEWGREGGDRETSGRGVGWGGFESVLPGAV